MKSSCFVTMTVAAALCVSMGSAAAEEINLSADAVNALIAKQEHNQSMRNYAMQVNQIVAGKLREIRVGLERDAMAKANNQPVPLPTGACRAVVSLAADGSVKQASLAGCASPELGSAELQAIQQAAPFPSIGHAMILTILTSAPIATPGVNGN